MNARTSLQYCVHDVGNGLTQNRGKFLLAIGMYIVSTVMFLREFQSYGPLLDSSNISLLDILIYYNKGMGVFDSLSGEPFVLPLFWISQTVLIAFVVSYYPVEDLSSYGVNVLVRSQKRWLWWLSKCVWVITAVLFFYGLGVFIAFLFTLPFGAPFEFPDTQTVLLISALDITDCNLPMHLGSLMIPIVISMALSLTQVSLSLFIGPTYSFVALMCYVFASVFFFSPLLIADYSMLLRNALFYPGGIQALNAFVVGGVVALVSIMLGIARINRIDIVSKNSN